ncbi:MAG: radical SAM protein [Candidatus Coproplasma sp.]
MEHKIYWVGPRKSDVSNVKDIKFYGSITLFGDGQDNNYAYCLQKGQNRVNHNLADINEDLFFYETIKRLIKEDPSVRFYFYNPNCVYYIEGLDQFKDYFLCINEREIMQIANNKTEFQKRLSGIVPLLDRKFDLHRNNCDYLSLAHMFNCSPEDNKKFIFQAPVSSGGNGTYLVKRENVREVINMLSSDGYIVSVYEENNVPVNIHAIIFDDHVLLSPGSIQIMKEDDNRLLYRGADFITYRTIAKESREKFESYVIDACKVFQRLGYRGVCGIDGIICGDEVKLLEINNRFQASTGLIDIAAKNAGLPSLQKINLAAFNGEWSEEFNKISTLKVDYSNYFFTDNGTKFHTDHIYGICKSLLAAGTNEEAGLISIDDDGYDETQITNSLAYLFRLTFNTNITSIFVDRGEDSSIDSKMWLNENICEPDKMSWYDEISPEFKGGILSQSKREIRNYFLRLKIALLTQGVTIAEDAKADIIQNGGLRPATNNAIDIRIDFKLGDKNRFLIINTPTDIKFVEFSPFKITLDNGELYLNYYGMRMMKIGVYPIDPVSIVRGENGEVADRYTEGKDGRTPVAYKEIAFLSTDRLRVHLTNYCKFKKIENGQQLGCAFCNIAPSVKKLNLGDIDEVVSEYCRRSAEIKLTHFLVGGQTAPDSEKENIVEIIKIIHKRARFAPIYAMVVPYEEEIIKKMYNAGMSQLACNIEVFDDEIARRYMPGKRSVPKETYIKRLKYATTLMGRKGDVRSMVIVGLEPYKSFISGIEELASNGIQPILSIFRPLPDTPLKHMQAPPMQYLVQIYNEVQRVCAKYNLFAGPECVNCQNNTLALPVWLEEK